MYHIDKTRRQSIKNLCLVIGLPCIVQVKLLATQGEYAVREMLDMQIE